MLESITKNVKNTSILSTVTVNTTILHYYNNYITSYFIYPLSSCGPQLGRGPWQVARRSASPPLNGTGDVEWMETSLRIHEFIFRFETLQDIALLSFSCYFLL